MAKKDMHRIREIDFFRGIAIIMMAIYHFMWDLSYFSLSDANLYSGFWGIFQKITAGLFITIVGITMTINYNQRLNKNNYLNYFIARGIRVFSLGLIITLGSIIFMPDSFVFFGILHFIGASIILTSLFVRSSYLNLFMSIASLAFGLLVNKVAVSSAWLVWLGFEYPVSSLDLFQLFPWISLVFFGLFLGNTIYPKAKRIFRIKLNRIAVQASRPVQFLGKNALSIYFIHIPLMFAIAYLVSVIL